MASPVLIRNEEKAPVVFVDPALGNIQLRWEAAGDPSGRDVQQVPSKVIEESVGFAQSLRKGILKPVKMTPEIEELLSLPSQTFQQTQEEGDGKVEKTIDRTQADRGLLALPCVGPGTREGTECGEPVAIREKDRYEHPPLCSRHKGLEKDYVSEELEPDPSNPTVRKIKWVRVQVDQRQTQQKE